MNRRRFLNWLGFGAVAPVLAPVNLTWRMPAPIPPSPDALTETLEVRVYGWVYGGREAVLLRRPIPVRLEHPADCVAAFTGPPDLALVLHGPVTVTRLVLEAPTAVRTAETVLRRPPRSELLFLA